MLSRPYTWARSWISFRWSLFMGGKKWLFLLFFPCIEEMETDKIILKTEYAYKGPSPATGTAWVNREMAEL